MAKHAIKIKSVSGFQDSEGKFHGTFVEAQQSEFEIHVRSFIDKEGIGRGGEWGADMFTQALLDNRAFFERASDILTAVEEPKYEGHK